MAKEIFNYEKLDKRDRAYYGFHRKGDRIHIDTKRIVKLGLRGYFPEGLFNTPRNTHYFVPRFKLQSEYNVNRLRSALMALKSDWDGDYKAILDAIPTPKDAADQTRLDCICGILDAEDWEMAEVSATMAAAKRTLTYHRVINGIHFQYLHRVFEDYLRELLRVISKNGYKKEKFVVGDLYEYVRECLGASRDERPWAELPHYKWFLALNRIDNFLKHNTVDTFEALANASDKIGAETKTFLASFVVSDYEYKNGMNSEDFVKVNPGTVDEFLSGLLSFSEEFCRLLYHEDPEEADWNSDQALIAILDKKIISEVSYF